MRRPVVVAAVAAMAAGAVAAAIPSSAHLVTAQPAGELTTITVPHSGAADLVLFDDATLSLAAQHNPDVHIDGRGRLVGFALSRSDGGSDFLAAARLPSFAGGRVEVAGSETPAQHCTTWPNDSVDLSTTCTGRPTAITLHEGYYHLVALADGAPLTITLRLHGQQLPRATVQLRSSFRSYEATLPERESLGSSTVTFGTDVAFADASGVLTVFAAKVHPHATMTAASLCVRSDQGAPPPYAFSAACPGGTSQAMAYRINDPAPQQGGIVFIGSPGPTSAPNGIGGSVSDSDGPRYLGGVGVWAAGADLSAFGAFASGVV